MNANAWSCVGMHGHANRFCKVHEKSNHGIQWVTYVSPQCASLAPVGCASRCMHTHVDLFELVLHTGDRHWELELRKVAYINIDQSAETPCPARMMSYT